MNQLQMLVLFPVSSTTKLNSLSSVVPVCSNSQNYDLKIDYM